MRCDVLVIGSTLGGLVAATYLAREGLRVVLIEEDAHGKRPPALREPFLLSGLESQGCIRRVLREIALPLREQQEIRSLLRPVQVVLPSARLDVLPDIDDMAHELAAYRLCSAEVAHTWLTASDRRGAEAREELWNEGQLRHGRPDTPGEKAPAECVPFRAALHGALRTLDAPPGPAAGALLLHTARLAVFRMPHAGTPFLDLFRRRLSHLYAEIHATGGLAVHGDRDHVEVELDRGGFRARALVVAVPREPLWRALAAGGAPEWLPPGPPVRHLPSRLFRVDSQAFPPGMGDRTIVSTGQSESLCWFSRIPDPGHPDIEWMLLQGPGAAARPEHDPFGELAPFGAKGVVPIETGAQPRWDLDGCELRIPSGAPPPQRTRVPVIYVGPEPSAGLGFEGEVLIARHRARELARQLTQGQRPVAFQRPL
jgi:hypothetical protein